MWTTPEEADFLLSRLPDYYAYQEEGKLIHFWPKVTGDFKERFPNTGKAPVDEPTTTDDTGTAGAPTTVDGATNEATSNTTNDKSTDEPAIDSTNDKSTDEPTISSTNGKSTDEPMTQEAEDAALAADNKADLDAGRKRVRSKAPPALPDRIKQWFSNRRGSRSEVPARKRATLAINGKATRKPLLHQVYQKMFWSRLKTVIDTRYAEYLSTIPAGQKPLALVAFRNNVAKELLTAEPDHVQAQVRAAYAEAKGAQSIKQEDFKHPNNAKELTDEQKHQMQLAYYDQNIGNLKATLINVVRDVYLQTGYILHVQGGGRNPGMGGKVRCFAINTRLPDGRSFSNHFGDYGDSVQEPFGDWMAELFPARDQAHYTLTDRGILLGTTDATPTASGEPTTRMRSGVEVEPEILVEPFAKAAETPTEKTRRPRPRPVNTARKDASSAVSNAKGKSKVVAPGDSEVDTDEDDYDMMDVPVKPAEDSPPRISPPRGTAYEQDRQKRMAKNKMLLDQLVGSARADLGFPVAQQPEKRMPRSVSVGPSERTLRSCSQSSGASSGLDGFESDMMQDSDVDAEESEEGAADDDDAGAGIIDTTTTAYLLELVDVEALPTWASIVNNIAYLEDVLGFPASSDTKHRFSAKNRPQQVADWIKRHRNLKNPPPIDDVPLFITEMQDWWIAAQPEGRGDTIPLSRAALPAKAWKALAKGGSNGFQIFLIAVSWWSEVVEDEYDCRQFEVFLEDVDWVLSEILRAITGRASSDDETDSRGRKRTKP